MFTLVHMYVYMCNNNREKGTINLRGSERKIMEGVGQGNRRRKVTLFLLKIKIVFKKKYRKERQLGYSLWNSRQCEAMAM